MILTKIIANEWRILFRSKVMLWLLLLIMALSFFTIWQTAIKYKEAHQKRTNAAHYMREKFTAQGAVNPHNAAHYGHFVYKPMHVLSIADEGVNPYTGVSLRLEAHKQNEVLFAPSQSSSSLIRFGALRLSLVLQVLLPLFIIFACHNAITKEREKGTLLLLFSQGIKPSQLIWGKTLAYTLVWWAVLAINMLMLWLVTGNITEQLEVGRLSGMLLLYAGYYLIITTLSIYVSAKNKTSVNALLVLLAAWLSATVLMPKATANIGDHLTPLLSRLDLQKKIEEDNKKGINGHDPKSERVQRFTDSILKKYGVDTVSQLPINVDGLTMQADEEYHNKVYDKHFGQVQQTIQKQNSITAKSSWINPFAAVRNLSMSLAGTDVYHHLNFTSEAEQYRRFLIRKMNLEMAYGGSKTGDWEWAVQADYWKRVEDFKYRQPGVSWSLSQHKHELSALLCWLIVSVLLVHLTSNRYNVL